MRIEGEAFVGQSASGEIDFITNGSDGPRYHQVSESVRDVFRQVGVSCLVMYFFRV